MMAISLTSALFHGKIGLISAVIWQNALCYIFESPKKGTLHCQKKKTCNIKYWIMMNSEGYDLVCENLIEWKYEATFSNIKFTQLKKYLKM